MEQINQIIQILTEKNVLFSQYEEVTDLLVKFDPDKAEDLVNEREQISNKIKKINQEIKSICDSSERGGDIRSAMYNKMNWSDCTEEYQPIFKLGQDITACISRLRRKEITIKEKAEFTIETIKEQIKKQNTGGLGKSAKYYRSTNPMGDQKFKLLNTKL